MKAIISITLTLLFVQASGQIINFLQFDSSLFVRNDTTFIKADKKIFNGIIKTKTKTQNEFSYYLNGLRSVDSIFTLSKKLQSVIRYRNNITTDRFLFDNNGNKFQEEIYLDTNTKTKQSFWWHPNGKLWKIEMFYNGQKSGKWYEWFQNGNLLFEGEFKEGEKFGLWRFYNAKTKKIIRQEKY